MEYLSTCETQFGIFEIRASNQGITGIRLQQNAPTEWEGSHSSAVIQEAKNQLKAYFQKKLTSFELPIDWAGATSFYQLVWKELLTIPYGHTTSYGAIAGRLGDPGAVRAVGQANRNNPIAIVVPCHRVIASNGNLQGYFYGLNMKRKLLALENPRAFAEQGSLFK